MEFGIGDIVICKKYYFYNGHFFPNDEFDVISYNDFNIKLKTKLGTYHTINYYYKYLNNINYNDNLNLYFWDLFYSKEELRRIKIKNIKQNINI